MNYRNEQGRCPKCGAELEFGVLQLEGDMVYYPYTCEECGQEGEEWYKLEFAGHNVYDEGGNLIELE